MNLCNVLIVLALCAVSSVVHANVSLIRWVFDFPGSPLLQGDQAYLGMLIMFKLMALSFILGLYPVVGDPPYGRRRSVNTPYFLPSTVEQVGKFLDNLAVADKNGCLLRLFCELGSEQEERLTLNQKAAMKLLKFMPKWIPTNLQDPRSDLMKATIFGSLGVGCGALGSACPYGITHLASLIS